MGPLRRMVPPVGRFDISPIVGLVIIWIFQAAVGGTLLRGWQLVFSVEAGQKTGAGGKTLSAPVKSFGVRFGFAAWCEAVPPPGRPLAQQNI